MKNSPAVQGKKKFVLTEIEKLDGSHPGVVSAANGWFDQGNPASGLPAKLAKCYGVSITEHMANGYREHRWVPHKELLALKVATIKAAVEAFGGDAGFDAALLAKLWEMMDEMTIPQIIAARNVFVRVRAQNLKEQEFLFKTGQLKLGEAEGVDPQEQQQKVLCRIKEIFGLAGDEPAPPPTPKALPPAEHAGDGEQAVGAGDVSPDGA